MTTTLPSQNHHESPSTPGLEIPGAFPREHTSTTRQRPLSDLADRPQPISLPSTEREGTHPGEHCGGVGSLPGTISETSVAKLPDERASEGKAAPAPPSRLKELTIDTGHGDEAVVPANSSVAKVPDERASEGRAASEPASRPKELVADTGDDAREDVVAPAPASHAAPGVTEQDSPVRRTDLQGPSAVGEQVPAERGAETEGTADSKFKEELRKEGKSSGAIEEGTRQPPPSRAAAVEDPAPPKGDEEGPNKAAAVQQQQQRQPETTGGVATRKGRSSSDSDAGNQAKATMMNRVKGEMKVLLGKASGNREKVEKGERLKHGAQ
ncbi:hypothetical protein EDB85DRAFT_805792 [Lactarius pseudohatsudake]|nr:hypothetical protein EDB85DRAFT_805792 [Lactarius pseudohatsudake]